MGDISLSQSVAFLNSKPFFLCIFLEIPIFQSIFHDSPFIFCLVKRCWGSSHNRSSLAQGYCLSKLNQTEQSNRLFKDNKLESHEDQITRRSRNTKMCSQIWILERCGEIKWKMKWDYNSVRPKETGIILGNHKRMGIRIRSKGCVYRRQCDRRCA